MSLTETFCKPIAFKVINEYGKGAAMQISTMFGPFTMLLFGGSLKRDFLNIDVTMLFGVCNFGNTSAMSLVFFFGKFQNLSQIPKMKKMSLTQTFCKSIAFTVINKYFNGGVLDASTMFGRIYDVAF